MAQPFFFRKDSKGDPIPGSNIKSNTKPSSAHSQVVNVINGPIPNSNAFKPSFSSGNRFFVQIDSNGGIISKSLVKSSVVPEGNYLEVFKNNIVALPLGSNENPGYIPVTLEEVASIRVLFSQDFLTNGARSNVTI